MMTRRHALFTCTGALSAFAAGKKDDAGDRVRTERLPEGAIQPQLALDDRGTLHLVYYTGDAFHGDLSYVRSGDLGRTFTRPIRVNSQSGSAVAAGTIRGAQLALGRSGRVHVAWNGSMQAEPKGTVNPDSGKPGVPMLYARLDDSGKAFEPQRNVMLHSFGLDGGGSIAADRRGNVYVAWHGISESEASGKGKEGEARRRVWVTKSDDDGGTFSSEKKAWSVQTGACGCCGMKIYSDSEGNISSLYRSATNNVHRDIYYLLSKDHGRSFQGQLLHRWEINACPMSSMDFAESGKMLTCAWETGGQVYWAHFDRGTMESSEPIPAPGEGKGRKHPRLAVNQEGQVLLVWTEGTGWQKGGGLSWQLFESSGKPLSETNQLPGIPVWSFAGVVTRPNGGFLVLY